MNILVICDDFYHSGDIVENGLLFLKEVYNFEFVKDVKPYSDKFSQYDVIMICKDNRVSHDNDEAWLNADVEQKLTSYVENGGGILVVHAGTVACKKSTALKNLVGCSFTHHPEQCMVDYIKKSDHDIMKNIGSFSEKDEHYFVDFTANDAEIFLESSSEHGTQPAGYTRTQGNGRVCVLTAGHNLAVWQNSKYMDIMKNALLWCKGDK